ncbi:hypothetical protein SESBI_46649 [Sesbania bispinosa]|nr:hypothetical protein SESBI_46649 [Sesbania bispinosa]
MYIMRLLKFGPLTFTGTPGRRGLRGKSPVRRFQESLKSPAKSPVGGGSESGGPKRVVEVQKSSSEGPIK